MLSPNLIDAFKFWRLQAKTRTAEMALFDARKDIANGKARYPATRGGMRGGTDWKLGNDNVFWCEQPDSYLRRVGFADECGLRSIRHNGWYMSDDNWTGETARGVVFQLPGRDRKPRFISGIADPNNEGCAVLSLEIFGEKEDAARNADSLAETYADNERDYQRAWRAGQEYSELGETISEARGECLALIAEVKANRAGIAKTPRICKLLREHIASYQRHTKSARRKRKELLCGYGNVDAFNEGRGL
jgi:hypothetical protein